MKQIEIERKFLLKRIPDEKFDDIITMDQWYLNVDGKFERVRQRKYKDGRIDWLHTIKEDVDEMTRIEYEKLISIDEYHDFIKMCKSPETEAKYIQKRRYILNVNNDVWEIDEFLENKMVIAEIEIPSKDYSVTIPRSIQDTLVYEVTGINEFSNKSLSEPI